MLKKMGCIWAFPIVARQWTVVSHPSDEDLSPHPSKQRPLPGDPESPGTPVATPAANDQPPGTLVGTSGV